MEERIQKIISASGYCSRRKAEDLIKQGKVSVNNKAVSIGDKADAQKDTIKIDNKTIKSEKKRYFILNKPKGVLVTMDDPDKRNTIYDLPSVRETKERIFPVGRLDAMSEGLIILTNDGEYANKIMHPRYSTNKTYMVRCEPKLKGFDKTRLEKGINIEGKKTAITKVTYKENNEFKITLHEGRNRIIRKMMEKLKYKIYMLKRLSIGNINIDNLKEGEVRELDPNEILKNN